MFSVGKQRYQCSWQPYHNLQVSLIQDGISIGHLSLISIYFSLIFEGFCCCGENPEKWSTERTTNEPL